MVLASGRGARRILGRRSPGTWAWLVGLLAAGTLHAQPIGTSFTYQGRLTDAGSPASGAYDLQLALFDAASGGAQVGPTLTRDDVVVGDGLFTTSLDFGAVFTGSKRWLELRVRPGASTGAYTTLGGRQELTPSPNAVFSSATPWAGVSGKPAGFADDTDDDALGALSCPNGQIAKRVAGVWACADDADSGGDITAVTAGTGLTGGGTSGAVTVGVNLAGSGSANTIARSDHDHFSQAWSGSSGNGLTITNAAGAAVRGLSTSTIAGTPGVYGDYGGAFGYGVHGNASSTVPGAFPMGVLGSSLHGYGVFGSTSDGVAVGGNANSSTGFTAGVLGAVQSPDGTGVYGQSAATTGFTMGVRGDMASTGGIAVWGYATSTAATGTPTGVEGRTDAPVGTGVHGFAAAGTGATVGVRGVSLSTAGTGVHGFVNATSGSTFGVVGETASSAGLGVMGRNTGVGGTGLSGVSATSTGSGIGVRAVTGAPTGTGLFASAQGANPGQNFGVWGESSSASGTGVHGQAWSTSGAATGVVGRSYATAGNGVWGQAFATTGQAWGVLGTSPSTTGIGVFGSASATAAGTTGVGVWGRASATGGFGGYFENSSGGPALGVSAGGIRFSDGTTQTTAAVGSSGDITAVLTPAGSGLTGGAASGDVTLGVGFAGSGAATTVSRSDHNHHAQSWTGTVEGGPSFRVINNAPFIANSTGMQGEGPTGVTGISAVVGGRGVVGQANGATGFSDGVFGVTLSASGRGAVGYAVQTSGANYGVWAQTDSTAGRGVYGLAAAASGTNYGVYGQTNSPAGFAGFFQGNVHVAGTLSKSAGSFRIDHPLDPENKYLYHSFVESPDMMNIYNGNVTTDGEGFATVELPEWFEALNRDFRYQLTVIGRFAQAIVAREVEDNRFTIQTSVPGVKVSWQVTGIRKDAFAEKHRIPVEQDKPEDERGKAEHGQY
jgi:hypothetical protein